MKPILRAAIASTLAAGIAVPGYAEAVTAAQSLAVSSSVSANCVISTSALAFGAYDPVSANAAAALSGSGGVSVTCTSGSSGTITLGQGASSNVGSTDAAPLRRMLNGTTNFLNYTLFQDAGLATVWANTAGTGVVHAGTGVSTAITVYGAIAAGQNVPAGPYADTVVATVTF